MIYLFDAFFFALGTIIGSFLNVVVLRHNTGESIITGESRCFNCGKKLKWPELIPLISFIVLKGRCSGCKSKISRQYPIVEFITGIVFLLIFLRAQPLVEWQNVQSIVPLFYALTFFSLLIAISVYDIKHQIIPDKMALALGALTLVPVIYGIISNFNVDLNKLYELESWQSLFAGMFLASFFALFWVVSSGRWMGLGDAKFGLGIGWFLGLPKTLLAFIFSFWLGAIVGVLLILSQGKKYSIKSAIPFGPFLAVGALIAFLFGDVILKDYMFFFYVS